MNPERIRETIDYNPETGEMRWKSTRQGKAKAGALAGCERKDGYRKVTLDGKAEYAHRIAWFIVHGVWPTWQIDHVNGNPRDNRIANLRDVPGQINSQNRRGPQRGVRLLGAYWCKTHKRWKSLIGVNGKSKHIGWFGSEEEAHAAFIEAKRRYHQGCTI